MLAGQQLRDPQEAADLLLLVLRFSSCVSMPSGYRNVVCLVTWNTVVARLLQNLLCLPEVMVAACGADSA